jgi:Flp pilus assembly protein TadB
MFHIPFPWYVPVLLLITALSIVGAWVWWAEKKMDEARKNNKIKKDELDLILKKTEEKECLEKE